MDSAETLRTSLPLTGGPLHLWWDPLISDERACDGVKVQSSPLLSTDTGLRPRDAIGRTGSRGSLKKQRDEQR